MRDNGQWQRGYCRYLRSDLARALVVLASGATGICGAEEISTPPPPDPVATIIVQGQKLDVESKIDRKIYTIPEDALGSVGTLSDILSVVPSIDVDPDGILSLRGDTHVLVLIDGQPATQLQGSSAGDALQSISAADIERIEVLTTPPAQYKSEGAAGVINIITRRRSARQKASGSLQGNLGDGGRSLVGATGSYGGKDFSTSAGASYRHDYRQRTIQSELIGPDPVTGQLLESRNHSSEHGLKNTPTVNLSSE